MPSDYYTHGSYPAQGATGDSASARTEFDAIQTAMNKLPAITGSGGRLIRVNAGATALESVTLATAAIESYDDAQKGTHTLLGGVAGTNTITATATPTLTAYTTGERFVFLAAGANTGASTLNVDGLGPINIVLPNGGALAANDILGANYPCHVIKRAADFVLLNPFVSASVGLHSAVSKTTPVGADELGLWDSVSAQLQKITITNLVAYLSGLCSAGWNALTSSSCTGNAATVSSVTGAAGNIAGSSGSCTGNAATATNATNVTGTAAVSGAVSSSSPTAGVGYATGAGGSVTQLTSITTAVTLNKMCGQITTFSYSYATDEHVFFTFNNPNITATDIVIINANYGGQSFHIFASNCAAGSCNINIHCFVGQTAGITFNFAVIKSKNA